MSMMICHCLAGADPEGRDTRSRTALMLAAIDRNVVGVEMLLTRCGDTRVAGASAQLMLRTND